MNRPAIVIVRKRLASDPESPQDFAFYARTPSQWGSRYWVTITAKFKREDLIEALARCMPQR